MAILGDEDGVFPLGGGFAVFGADGPAVFGVEDGVANACVDHGLDGEDHAGGHGNADVVVMVGDFRGFVKGEADAVANKLIHNGAFVGFGDFFDSVADFADFSAGFANGDGGCEGFEAGVDDALLFFGGVADNDHAAGVAEVSVENAGGVDVEDVAVLKGTFVRDAVADDFVERCADGFRIGGTAVAERGWDDVVFFVELS